MMNPSQDVASHIVIKDACSSESSGAPSVITAAGGLDNSEVTGVGIDRKSSKGDLADSMSICTSWLAALDSGETISLGHKIQYSSDNNSFDTAVVIEAATVVKTAGSADNFRGEEEHTVNLRGQKRYYRVNVTLDLSRANTDTASFATQVAMGGYAQLPV